jgi:cell division protein FtsB
MPTPRKKTSSFTERVKKAAQMTAEEQATVRNEENVPSKKRKPSQRRTDSTQQRRSKSSNTRNSEDISAHCSKQNDKPRRRTTANLTESQDTYKRLNGKSSKQSRTNTRNQSRNTDSAASKSNRQTARNSQNIKLERISTQENSQSGGTNKRSKRDHIAPKKEGLVSGKLQALRNLPKRTISLTIIVILIVASCAIVYPVGKTWYKSLRDEQRQTAILEAENARNEELSKANEALKTEEGIEDEARKSGYVKKGEKSVSVSNGSDSGDTSTGLPAQIDETKIHAPQTWYYKILDTIFFVES